MNKVLVFSAAALTALVFFLIGAAVWIILSYGRTDLVLFGAVGVLGAAQLASFLSKRSEKRPELELDLASEVSKLWDVVQHLDERITKALQEESLQSDVGMGRFVSELKGQIVVLQSAVNALSQKTPQVTSESSSSPAESPKKAPTLSLVPPPAIPSPSPLPTLSSPARLIAKDKPAQDLSPKSTEDDSLILFLEPVIDWIKREVVFHRASLMSRSKLCPSDLPVIESAEMDFSCLKRVLATLKKQKISRIIVPLSAASFSSRFFMDRLIRLVKMYPAHLEGLVFELKESVFFQLPDEGLEALASLADLGIHFSLSESTLSFAQDWETLKALKIAFLDTSAGALVAAAQEGNTDLSRTVRQAKQNGIDVIGSDICHAHEAHHLIRIISYARGPFLMPSRAEEASLREDAHIGVA